MVTEPVGKTEQTTWKRKQSLRSKGRSTVVTLAGVASLSSSLRGGLLEGTELEGNEGGHETKPLSTSTDASVKARNHLAKAARANETAKQAKSLRAKQN